MQRINLYLKIINYVPLIIILFFVFLLIMGAFIIWPKFGEYGRLKQNVEIREIELRYKEEYIAKLEGIKRTLEENAEQVSKIESALPDEISTPSIYKFMTEAASQSGMVLDSISPFNENNSAINSRLKEVSFSMNLTGSYSALKEFLSIAEKSARMFDMNSVSLSNTDQENVYKFQLTVKAFNY